MPKMVIFRGRQTQINKQQEFSNQGNFKTSIIGNVFNCMDSQYTLQLKSIYHVLSSTMVSMLNFSQVKLHPCFTAKGEKNFIHYSQYYNPQDNPEQYNLMHVKIFKAEAKLDPTHYHRAFITLKHSSRLRANARSNWSYFCLIHYSP